MSEKRDLTKAEWEDIKQICEREGAVGVRTELNITYEQALMRVRLFASSWAIKSQGYEITYTDRFEKVKEKRYRYYILRMEPITHTLITHTLYKTYKAKITLYRK